MKLPSGYQNVDQTSDAEAFIASLSALDALPFFQEYKQHSYELLQLGRGETVLDAGCGLGFDVYRMADLVGDGGRVVGLDYSQALIQKAASLQPGTTQSVSFCVGDLRNLPFESGSFSRVRIDRVLQCLPDPETVMPELKRVLSPGGLLLAYDNDWGSFSIASQYKDVTRTIERLWCDSCPSGWIGRDLTMHFISNGLDNLQVVPKASVNRDFELANGVFDLQGIVEKAIALNEITAEEGRLWLEEMNSRNQVGAFFLGMTSYTVVGERSL